MESPNLPATPNWTGWKKLDRLLEILALNIDVRTPIKGNGILFNETPSGVIISIDPQQIASSLPKPTGGGGGGGGGGGTLPTAPDGTQGSWQSINVVDQNCNQYTMYVWGTNPALQP